MQRLLVCLLLATPLTLGAASEPAFRVLVFSKTAGYRHAAIPAGIAAIWTLAEKNGFAVDATEDATVFRDDNLKRYAVVVFLSTTGDVLDEAQQKAFEGYIKGGGGFVGVHAATDTEYDWPFYGETVGAYFASHPKGTPTAIVRVEDANHPSTKGLPKAWTRVDEWYNFKKNPRPNVRVLATVDETSYEGGTLGADHPVIWAREAGASRAWYTALGHTPESYADPVFLAHLLGGIQYAAKAAK